MFVRVSGVFHEAFVFGGIKGNVSKGGSSVHVGLCLHSLLGRVGELVLPLPSVAFLDPLVAPQALDGVGVGARQCLHFLHFDLANHGGICLRNEATHVD